MPLQPSPRARMAGSQPLDKTPKPRSVVHLDQMRHLMGNDMVQYRFWDEDQPPTEREVAVTGAAAPTARCVAHVYPFHLAADLCGQPPRPGHELVPRRDDEMVANPARQMCRIAANPD